MRPLGLAARELEETERNMAGCTMSSKAHLLLEFCLSPCYPFLRARYQCHRSFGPDILLWDFPPSSSNEPGDGKKVSWHQDLTYWGLDPDDVVSVWLALSQATNEKRLHGYDPWIAQGSHRCPP
jgi:hypothetical protein